MEFTTLTKDDLAGYLKESVRTSTGIELPSGKYQVLGLEKKSTSKTTNAAGQIVGIDAKWIEIHVKRVDANATESGSFSVARLATAGFSDKPIESITNKGKYYFPSVPLKSFHQGTLADMVLSLQGKTIDIEAVPGMVPRFQLASFENKKAAEDAAVKGGGFSTKSFYRITKATQSN